MINLEDPCFILSVAFPESMCLPNLEVLSFIIVPSVSILGFFRPLMNLVGLENYSAQNFQFKMFKSVNSAGFPS